MHVKNVLAFTYQFEVKYAHNVHDTLEFKELFFIQQEGVACKSSNLMKLLHD